MGMNWMGWHLRYVPFSKDVDFGEGKDKESLFVVWNNRILFSEFLFHTLVIMSFLIMLDSNNLFLALLGHKAPLLLSGSPPSPPLPCFARLPWAAWDTEGMAILRAPGSSIPACLAA